MKTCKGCKHYKKDEDNGLIICEFGYEGWHRCVKDGEDFAIEELEKIKEEIRGRCRFSINKIDVLDIIDKHISEMKGK